MTNVDYLDKQEGSDTWVMNDRSKLEKDYVNARAMRFADGTDTIKVVGVVRPKRCDSKLNQRRYRLYKRAYRNIAVAFSKSRSGQSYAKAL